MENGTDTNKPEQTTPSKPHYSNQGTNPRYNNNKRNYNNSNNPLYQFNQTVVKSAFRTVTSYAVRLGELQGQIIGITEAVKFIKDPAERLQVLTTKLDEICDKINSRLKLLEDGTHEDELTRAQRDGTQDSKKSTEPVTIDV